MSLAHLLPAPKAKLEVHAEEPSPLARPTVARCGGRECLARVALPRTCGRSGARYAHAALPGARLRRCRRSCAALLCCVRVAIPPYGKRKGYVPRAKEDFGDGGAFPEIHVAQYPLDLGRADRKSTAIVAVNVAGDGASCACGGAAFLRVAVRRLVACDLPALSRRGRCCALLPCGRTHAVCCDALCDCRASDVRICSLSACVRRRYEEQGLRVGKRPGGEAPRPGTITRVAVSVTSHGCTGEVESSDGDRGWAWCSMASASSGNPAVGERTQLGLFPLLGSDAQSHRHVCCHRWP
jgi:hypothetical protein